MVSWVIWEQAVMNVFLVSLRGVNNVDGFWMIWLLDALVYGRGRSRNLRKYLELYIGGHV
jgi:hypothetical protein